jgi:hypothetical protein
MRAVAVPLSILYTQREGREKRGCVRLRRACECASHQRDPFDCCCAAGSSPLSQTGLQGLAYPPSVRATLRPYWQ